MARGQKYKLQDDAAPACKDTVLNAVLVCSGPPGVCALLACAPDALSAFNANALGDERGDLSLEGDLEAWDASHRGDRRAWSATSLGSVTPDPQKARTLSGKPS